MLKHLLSIIFLISAFHCQAIEYINGEISGTLNTGEYIVTSTLYILKDKVLHIAPGVKLYFEQFSGVTVLGELHCNGTPEAPILFTSVKENTTIQKNAIPSPFDWNGIEIQEESAVADFNHSIIRFGTFGIKIKSKKTDIHLYNVEFHSIGYTSLLRDGKIITVQQDMPFCIIWNEKEPSITIDTVKKTDPVAQNTPALAKPKKISPRITFQIGSPAIAISGGAMLIASSILATKHKKSYDSETDPQNVAYYRNQFHKSRICQYVGSSMMAVGIISTGITFFF